MSPFYYRFIENDFFLDVLGSNQKLQRPRGTELKIYTIKNHAL